MRSAILKIAPDAAEAVRFGVLCYYHADAWFGAIGGNICMIEVKSRLKRDGGGRGAVLSFIHGALLPDPKGILRGKGKTKRFVLIPDVSTATSPPVKSLIRAANDLGPWD